jgi:hypothetical protein
MIRITMEMTDHGVGTQIIAEIVIKLKVMALGDRMCEDDQIGRMVTADDPLVPSCMKNIIWNVSSTLYNVDCGRLTAS